MLNSKNRFSYRYLEFSSTIESVRIYLFEDHELINKESSISIRQNLIKNGLKSFVDSKGIGVGGGNSNYIHKEDNMKSTGKILSMHNFWIEILVEGGFLMFIIFGVWYFSQLFTLRKISKRTNDNDIRYFAKAGEYALIGFSISLISLSSVIYFLPMWILFGFNLSTIRNYKKIIKDENTIIS